MRLSVRLLPVLGLVVFGAVVVLAQNQAAPQPQRPVFRTEAQFVTVDAYPTRDGEVVRGLTAADFVVEEDGKPQSIENFEFIDVAAEDPAAPRRDPNTVEQSRLLAADARTRAFVVYLDVAHVSISGGNRSRGPLVTMLNQLVGPRDLFAVTTSMTPVRGLTFARMTTTAEDMLTRHWPWGRRDSILRTPLENEIDQCFPSDAQGQQGWVRDGSRMRPLADVLRERAREEQTLNGLEDLIDHLGGLREGRTSVVLFTEGWRLFRQDNSLAGYTGQMMRGCEQHLLRYSSMDSQFRLRDIIQRANRRNVTFFTVNPDGLSTFDTPINERVLATGNLQDSPLAQEMDNLRDRASSMQTLADQTDGFAVVNTNNIKAGLGRITRSLSAYYLLGYYSSNSAFDGKPRRITVTVKQPGVDVKARRGYIAPTEAERAARAAAASAPAAGPSPVAGALDALARLRPTSDVLLHVAREGTRLHVVGEIGASEAARSATTRSGTFEVAVTDASGAAVGAGTVEVAAAQRAAEVVVTLGEAAATGGPLVVTGKWRASGSVFDSRADAIAEPSAVLGSMLIFRATPSSRSPLVPVAGYQFRRTERVHVEFPVRAALDARSVRVLGRTGDPVTVTATATEIEREGRTTLAVDVLLAPLAPGDYVIEVTAGAGGKTETRLVGIRVVS